MAPYVADMRNGGPSFASSTLKSPIIPSKYYCIFQRHAPKIEQVKKEDPRKPACQMCGDCFTLPLQGNIQVRLKNFTTHAISHSPLATLHCKLCSDFRCRRMDDLQAHLLNVHTRSGNKVQLRELHQQIITESDQPIIDEFEQKCFPGLREKVASSIPRRSKGKASGRENQFMKCELCNQVFMDVYDNPTKREHVLTHHVKADLWQCTLCEFTGRTHPVMRVHAKNEHPDVKITKKFNKYMSKEDDEAVKKCINECFPKH